ncbi:hypothetical protein VNI00_006164 [Paramarasmius palmivorus]|uniref:3'-5' exonuclease n=1 Tax=Paramarasmius palmivorus TaxID=297713 RepID=A0AAW0DAA8_9AGAR
MNQDSETTIGQEDDASLDRLGTEIDAHDSGTTADSEKRRPGRPKGSKNKTTLEREAAELQDGSDEATANEQQTKRLVGRPRKVPVVTGPAVIRSGTTTVAGSDPTGTGIIPPIFHRRLNRAVASQSPTITSNQETSSSAPTSALPISQTSVREETLLPHDDPSRKISLNAPDDDGLDPNVATGEGVGSDDDDDFGIGVEIDDDSENPSVGRRPPPLFVMRIFNKHLEFIKQHTSGAGNHVTSDIYRRSKSFWLPKADTFFLLYDENISPTSLYNPRFFYWDPLLLVDEIPCPKLGCLGRLTRYGLSQRPRRVVGMEDCFWLIAKQIGKVEGERVFEGLLSITNSKGQLRQHSLVPTKAQSCFTNALTGMRNSILTFGLSEPKVFFTDNMADKPMLERHFPSLLDGVSPITRDGHLPKLKLPEDVTITVLAKSNDINDAIRTIVDGAGDDELLTVALDTEWNVDLDARRRGIPDHRRTAILQIAHRRKIWIFQIIEHVAAGNFPAQLSTFLANPQVRKVGRNIALDLQGLEEANKESIPYVGGLDLAKLAKEKGVIKDARISLPDLCAKVLEHQTEKDPSVRVNSEWTNSELAEAQVMYAALDAWVSLEGFPELDAMAVPVPVLFSPIPPNPGLEVFIYQEDRTRIIARGRISDALDKAFDGINVTKTHVLIVVDEVYVPAAMIAQHHQRELKSFGTTPFSIVCKKIQIRTFVPSFIPETPTSSIPSPTLPIADPAILIEDQPIHSLDVDLSRFERLDIGFRNNPEEGTADTRSTTQHDEVGKAECEKILRWLEREVSWPGVVRSCVLEGVFHVFRMIYIPRTHGLRVTFSRALRDAIFLPDAEWLARLAPPMTWDECSRSHPSFIKTHCKFTIPPPGHLLPVVTRVVQDYGDLRDATSGDPLFSPNAWKTIKDVLEIVKLGCVSDPPDTGTFNTSGQRYRGHFDLWIINKRQRLINSDLTRVLVPGSRPLAGWVNAELYSQTKVFGVLSIPRNVQASSGMLPFDPGHKLESRACLARKRDVWFAALTVHTSEEKKLFSTLMDTDTAFRELDWPTAVRRWNTEANGMTVFYKVRTQRKSDCRALTSMLFNLEVEPKCKRAVMATATVRKAVDRTVHHKGRLLHIPALPSISANVNSTPTAGELPPEEQPSGASASRIVPLDVGRRTFSRKRTSSEIDDGDGTPADEEPKRIRSRRACAKCGRGEGCKGSASSHKCTNPCQDCGKAECQGRNNRSRKRPCPNIAESDE